WQSFAAAALPLGDSRPTWKVLRVMGNLFELDGFDYRESTEIKSEILEHKEGRDPQNLGAWMQPTEGARGWTGITRIGEMPIYAVDPLVRRAQALQKTVDATVGNVRMGPDLAGRLGLRAGDAVNVSQGGTPAELEVVVDPGVPDGCAVIPTGVTGTAGLGPSYGEVTIERVR
ncbi:MAG: NADH-quinone oxidoreductase subunit G, partial [Gammaproteobacteria bacterium]|nr:NADH-quinone oxidoreductase subunit G [Gammaproteobacteria bacterium]